MSVSSYRDLRVWQAAMQLAKEVYKVSAKFPKWEMYGITSQITRAAVSIPSNIAEGHARDSRKEFLHHISIAMGSLAELETQLELATELEFVDSRTSQSVLQLADGVGKMLRGLQKTLKTKRAPSP